MERVGCRGRGGQQISELYVQNENKLVRENWLWSGKSQGKVREFCFTQTVDTLYQCHFSDRIVIVFLSLLGDFGIIHKLLCKKVHDRIIYCIFLEARKTMFYWYIV